MKAARSFTAARRAMIDHNGFKEALDRVRLAQKNVSLRIRPGSEWLFAVCIYNLTLMGRIKEQADVDHWLTEQWKERGGENVKV